MIKSHREKLLQFHVKEMFVFGSVARNEGTPGSDIDILVAFNGPPTFDQFMDLKFYLEDLFQREVDLVTESGLRPELRDYVKKDSIRIV